MALTRKFFGSMASDGAAFAFGYAASPVLLPAVESLRQEAWSLHAVRLPAVGVLAEGVAQGQVDEGIARGWATKQGFGDDAFSALINVANVGPGSGFAFELWRRKLINQDGFTRALKRLGIEDEWIADLVKIHDVLLTVDQLSNAVVQGHMSQDDATAEAALQGYTADRFDILVQNTGLPPGPETLLAWKRRGIVTDAQFQTGILEGHTKPKYIPFYEAATQPLLSAATAVRLYLKGWYTKAQRDALGADWGYSSQQMEDWFLSEGRPATVHQIHIGYARGAKLQGAANEEDAIRTSVKQSDIRPEYADLLYAQRYTYPSAFVLRGLVTSGAISKDEGEQALLFSGWEPTFAAKVASSWARTGTGTTADTHEEKAQTQLWTTTHASYKANEISAPTATQALAKAGVDAATIPAVLAIWDEEKALIRARLTAADVRKAYRKQDENPATGAAWTRADAKTQLLSLGYSDGDAEAYLNIG